MRAQFLIGDTQWVEFRDAKEYHPCKTAQYIVDYYKSQLRNKGKDRTISWTQNVLHGYARAVCRMARLYDFVLDDNNTVCHVRRAMCAKKK